MSHRSAGISSSMALVLASAIFSGPAAASDVANVKSISFNAFNATKPIRVISTNGKNWNRLASDDITFSGDMSVNTRHPGFVNKVGVVLGGCTKNLCQGNPQAWSRQIGERDWSGHGNFAFNTSVLPVSADGIGGLSYGKEIIAACNDHLQPDGPTKSYEFDTSMEATFVVDTGIAWGGAGQYGVFETGEGTFPDNIDYSRRDSLKVRVICDPVIKSPTNDIAIDEGKFEPEDIKLFLATINGANTDGSNPATKCPALRVTTRVETSKAGGVDIRLWRQEGQGPITSEFKSAYASFDAVKNGYFADFVRTEKFDATTWLQFMAEVVGDPFAPSTQWKDITVHCTSPGGGGLTNGEPDHGDDPVFPPERPKPQVDTGSNDLAPPARPDPDGPKASWTGEVTMADNAGARKSCPRKGQVFFAVTRNEPGNFKYKISCNNGQQFGGSVQSFSQGSPTFEAYGAHDININRTRTIQCTLQEVKPNNARVTIDKGALDYTCNNPAIDPSADDLVADPKPRPDLPRPSKPDVSILCKPGFKLEGRQCIRKPVIVIACAPHEQRIKDSCVPKVIIDCAKGFKLEGRKCVRKPVIAEACKATQLRRNGKCIDKPTVSILCKPGFKLEGQNCVRKPVIVDACKTTQLRRNGHCVNKPTVSIVCKSGFKLEGEKCVRKPVMLGKTVLKLNKKAKPLHLNDRALRLKGGRK